MKHIFIVLALTGLGQLLYGQSLERAVLANAGSESSVGDIRLAWTLGETAVAYRMHPQGQLSEGFHQPALRVINQPAVLPDFLGQSISPTFAWQVFPNPTQATVTVLASGLNEPATLQLFDARGRMFWSGVLPTDDFSQALDLTSQPAGQYWLVARNQHGEVLRSAQIIKQ